MRNKQTFEPGRAGVLPVFTCQQVLATRADPEQIPRGESLPKGKKRGKLGFKTHTQKKGSAVRVSPPPPRHGRESQGSDKQPALRGRLVTAAVQAEWGKALSLLGHCGPLHSSSPSNK